MMPSAASNVPAPADTVLTGEGLAALLRAEAAEDRRDALMRCVQPNALVDGCIAEMIQCALKAPKDPIVLQFVAVGLGAVTPKRMTSQGLEMLSALADPAHPDPVRVFAAHGLFRQKQVPASALSRLASMLILPEAPARQTALLALTMVIAAAAPSIAQVVAGLRPEGWTLEALTALARSAMPSAKHRQDVEGYIVRSMTGAALVPTGVAGYSALAQICPDGPAVSALAQIASQAPEPAQWKAALAALTTLGESAKPAATHLGQFLGGVDEPEREEALCRTLVSLCAPQQDVPLRRVVERIASGPERSAAAHCMLLALHAKSFGQAAGVVRQRHLAASAALRPTLEQTYLALTGQALGGNSAQRS